MARRHQLKDDVVDGLVADLHEGHYYGQTVLLPKKEFIYCSKNVFYFFSPYIARFNVD